MIPVRTYSPVRTYTILNIKRLRQYFINGSNLFEDYKAAINLLLAEGKDKVGFDLGGDDYEYPLWGWQNDFKSRGFRSFGMSVLWIYRARLRNNLNRHQAKYWPQRMSMEINFQVKNTSCEVLLQVS